MNGVRRGSTAGPSARPHTVAELIAAFKRHRFYTELAPKTRRWYDQNLAVVEAWAGTSSVLAIDKALVDALYTSMRDRTPARARAVVTALRRLYEYGKIPFGKTSTTRPGRWACKAAVGRQAGCGASPSSTT